MKKVKLDLDYLEFGQLYASIKDKAWENFTRTLWLKLKIAAASAYVDHEKFGKKAKEEVKRYQKELDEELIHV